MAAPGARHDLARPLLHVGAVAIAWRIQQHGHEAVEGVGTREQADPRPVVEMQDALRNAVELVLVNLEQLIARISLHDVAEPLASVGAGIVAGAGKHVLHLAADQRHIKGRD